MESDQTGETQNSGSTLSASVTEHPKAAVDLTEAEVISSGTSTDANYARDRDRLAQLEAAQVRLREIITMYKAVMPAQAHAALERELV